MAVLFCKYTKNPTLNLFYDEFRELSLPFKNEYNRQYDNSIFTGKSIELPPENCSLNEILISTPLMYPVENGKISCQFGYRTHPITGKRDFHRGVDIAVPINSNIYSALNGVVKEIGENRIYGKYVILSHSDNFETAYCHCNDILVKEGIYIRRGERLGKSGNTGLSTGPHLHFEIKYNGKYYNPEYLI